MKIPAVSNYDRYNKEIEALQRHYSIKCKKKISIIAAVRFAIVERYAQLFDKTYRYYRPD